MIHVKCNVYLSVRKCNALSVLIGYLEAARGGLRADARPEVHLLVGPAAVEVELRDAAGNIHLDLYTY